MRAQIGIPHALAGIGVDDSELDRIVALAPQDPTAAGNPVSLDAGAAREIFKRALDGTV